MKKKSSFKGKGKMLSDPVPQKQPPKPLSPAKTDAATPSSPPKPPEPAGPPPGPENRQTKISSRDAYKASDTAKQIHKENDEDLKLSSVDVKGLRVGADVKPKTFADVAKAKSKPPPTTANIKFNILVKKQIYTVEAKFATNEPLEHLYTYLEKEVFSSVSNLEIRNSYPQTVIPRDPNKVLASLKLHGQVMLQVSASDAKLKS